MVKAQRLDGCGPLNKFNGLKYSLVPPEMVLLCSLVNPVLILYYENWLTLRVSRDNDSKSSQSLVVTEMERDALCAHGVAQFLKERSVDNSDIYSIRVCDLCGLFAHKVPDKKHYICRSCQNTTKISEINIPYACKLFFQELRAMNILPHIITAKSIITNNR